MNRTAKIQAAIDALPHATGGEWTISEACLYSDHDGRRAFISTAPINGEANATLITASKDLAEEVVRLRGLVKEAYLDGQRSIQDAIPRSVVPSDPLTFPESAVKEKLNAP